MARADGRERARDGAPLLGRRGREPLAEPPAAGVDAQLLPRLGIDEPEDADVGQLLLAWVADLDRDDVVPARELEQLPAPVPAAAEVGDDDDERALARERVRPRERLTERRRPELRPRPARSRSAVRSPMSPTRPCRGGSMRGFESPKVTTPSRFPRRVARWPTAIATPSATSALRRSAVPNCIETDVSRTSQLTRTRSASVTRTCGSFVRAVTFQSIRRTSSPGDVRPDERELGALAVERRAVVAGEQSLDAPPDADVERAQERLGHRPGAGASWAGDGWALEPQAALDLARSICGTGTAAST